MYKYICTFELPKQTNRCKIMKAFKIIYLVIMCVCLISFISIVFTDQASDFNYDTVSQPAMSFMSFEFFGLVGFMLVSIGLIVNNLRGNS